MSDQPSGAATGPGDETHRLLAAVQDWARRALPAPPSGHGGPECQWCPLCQLAAVLRGEHPELTERMAEAGAALTNAVRALADPSAARAADPPAGPADPSATSTDPSTDPSATDPAAGGTTGATTDAGPRRRPKPGNRVQRIPLAEEPE